ncbi:hypothetical protein [Nonomuraea sp. NPDC023979]|uniref:hypothetical protein n=1 Tax=Nonomuraea sp. NPDC023979 TaxID=3154796 RepID=UPI0033FD4CA3
MTAEMDDPQDEQAALINELANEVEQLAEAVAELHAAAPQQAGSQARAQLEPAPRPWCWPRMPHSEKADRLDELAAWVRDVLFAWPGAQQAILPCWPRHWDVIDELSMLYCAWQTAYLWESRTASDAGYYLDRLLPSMIERAKVRLRPCSQGHHPDGARRDDTDIVQRTIVDLRRLTEG